MKPTTEPPKLGDIRYKKRFALFPIKTRDNEWVWFKTYIAVQEYKKCFRYGEEVISEGIIFEKVRCYYYIAEDWNTIYKIKNI
jgi:hypothetical protein